MRVPFECPENEGHGPVKGELRPTTALDEMTALKLLKNDISIEINSEDDDKKDGEIKVNVDQVMLTNALVAIAICKEDEQELTRVKTLEELEARQERYVTKAWSKVVGAFTKLSGEVNDPN